MRLEEPTHDACDFVCRRLRRYVGGVQLSPIVVDADDEYGAVELELLITRGNRGRA